MADYHLLTCIKSDNISDICTVVLDQPKYIKYVTIPEILDNVDIMMFCIAHDIRLFKHASFRLRNNFEFIKFALKCNYTLYSQLSEKLRDVEKIYRVVMDKPGTYQFASKRLQNMTEFAVHHLKMFPMDGLLFKNNFDVMKESILHNKYPYHLVGNELKMDIMFNKALHDEITIDMINNNPLLIRLASEETKTFAIAFNPPLVLYI